MSRFWKRYKVEISLYFGFLMAYLLLLIGPNFPHIFPEEAGYIGWARYLLRGEGSGNYFLPGYSLLLLPIFAVTDQLSVAYPLVLVLNSCLAAFLPVGYYRLACLLGEKLSCVQRVLITIAVCLYPSSMLYAGAAICESLMQVCLVFLYLSVARLCRNSGDKWGWWGTIGFTLFLVLIHTRAFVFLPVVFLWVFCLLWRRRDYQKRLVWVSGCFGLVGIAVCVYFFTNQTSTVVLHMREQVVALLSPRMLWQLVATLLSQGVYLLFSTYGFFALGISYAFHLCKTEQKRLSWFLLGCFAVSAFASALFMCHHSKPIQILYGRYNDVVLPVFLLLGLVGIFQKSFSWKIWIIPIGAALLTGLLYGTWLNGLGNATNALGIILYRLFLTEFRYWFMLLFYAVLAGVLFWLGRFYKQLAVGCLIILFGFTVCYGNVVSFDTESRNAAQPKELLRILSSYEDGRSSLYNLEDRYIRAFYPYSLALPGLTMSSQEEGQPFLLTRGWIDGYPLVGIERGEPLYLWAANEQVAEQFRSHNALLPTSFPAVVEDCKSRISLLDFSQEKLVVRLENLGSPWLSLDTVRDIQSAVRLGILFLDENDQVMDSQRQELEHILYQGDFQDFTVFIPQGAKSVHLEAVQDFQTWFSQRGDSGSLTLDLESGLPREFTLPLEQARFQTLYFDHLENFYPTHRSTYVGNLEQFYQYWTAGEGSAITNVAMPVEDGRYLIVKTHGEGKRKGDDLQLQVTLNDTFLLPYSHYEEDCYYFSLEGFEDPIVGKISFSSATFNPAKEARSPFSFISMDSPLRLFHGLISVVRDWTGVDINAHEFGVDIDCIMIR